MEHEWFKNGERHRNVIVECRVCGYKTSAGYSENPNFNWFVVGRIMPEISAGIGSERPIPRCDDYLLEIIHDR